MARRTGLVVLLGAALAVLIPAQAIAGAADQGSFFISGQLGMDLYFGSDHPEDTQGNDFEIWVVPSVLYFPVQSIGVGIMADFDYWNPGDGYKQTYLAIGPRAAYFLKFGDKRYPSSCCLSPWLGPRSMWMPFFGVSLMYVNDHYGSDYWSSTSSGWLGRLGVGVAPRIGDRGAAILELGFQHESMSYSSGVASTQTCNKIYLEGGFGAFLFRD